MQARCDAKSDTWSSAQYADLKVTVFGGHTAIATGTFVGKGTDAAGKPARQVGLTPSR